MKPHKQAHMTILNIETSTHVCSVSLSCNGKNIFSKSDNHGQNHAALLNLFIEEALKHLPAEKSKPDAVAVSSGPGSYTGLRIGVSAAKGLCYGFDIPLISVNTLQLMAYAAIQVVSKKENTLFCPMIDARRMEVYSAFYDADLNVVRDIKPDIITEGVYNEYLSSKNVVFFGNGMEKCRELLTHPHSVFILDINPLSDNMLYFSEKAFSEGKTEDVAYFEPFYLKEFQVTTPKKKV